MSYGSIIQCQKIYILCFVSTKYISFVTEYIVSMAVQCSDVHLIQCQKIYTLCYVSTKYICVVTEHIISMAVQCSDVDSTLFHIVCCLYSLNGYVYILCIGSTKYISFVTENILCTSLHCVSFRQNISPLTLNTPFLCHCNAAMLIQHCSHCMLLVFLKRL